MVENVENLILEQLRLVRAEQKEARTLLLQSIDYTRRLERRLGELERRVEDLRDDLELTIKVELGGRLAHFETRMENMLSPLAERVSALEAR